MMRTARFCARSVIYLLLGLGVVLTGVACVEPASGSANRADTGANNTSTEDMGSAGDDDNMASGDDGPIVSAYHSQKELTSAIGFHCFIAPGPNGAVILVFSTPLDKDSLDVEDFIIGSGDETMTPKCARFIPFPDEHEKTTVVLAGNFEGIGGVPESVDVVGTLDGLDGTSLRGARADVEPFGTGARLAWAERYAPDDSGFSGVCPGGTAQIIQLVWSAGVKGNEGDDFGSDSLEALTFTLDNGDSVSPMALGDDDSDNYVVACLGATSPAVSVSATADAFFDSKGNANPESSVGVVEHE